MANNKFKNTREVVFEEAFGSQFKKGSKHYMHKELAEKLSKSKEAKVKVSTFDYDTAVAKARKANADAKAEQEKVNAS